MTNGHDKRAMAGDLRGADGSAMDRAAAQGVLRGRDAQAGQRSGELADRGRESGETEVACVTFTVPGAPVGKGRPRFAKRGNFVQAYTPEKTASYENLVKLAAAQAMKGGKPIEGAIELDLFIRIPIPASWSQKKRRAALEGKARPTSKPDIDNVLKGICDALNGIVWADDKQVVTVSASKHYAPQGEVFVTAWKLA